MAAIVAGAAVLLAGEPVLGAPAHEPRARKIDAETARAATSVRIADVRRDSLWADGRFIECVAAARYAGAARGAQFGAVMVFQKTATAEVANTPRRAKLTLAASNAVALKPGALPAVRVRKHADSPGLAFAKLMAA